MIPLFTSSQRACPTGSLKRHEDWVMSGFGYCSLFEVDMGIRARHKWKFPIVIEYCLGKMFQEPIFEHINVLFCWGERDFFLGALAVVLHAHWVWSWHLIFNVCPLKVCIALPYLLGLILLPQGLGSLWEVSLCRCRLFCWRVCLVIFLWTMNFMGSQPWHTSVKPPTAQTIFFHGMRLFIVSPIFTRCLSLKKLLYIQKGSSNLPHSRLEQRGNGFPTPAEVLLVHHWQSPRLLPWRLAPDICQQQVLRWCRL